MCHSVQVRTIFGLAIAAAVALTFTLLHRIGPEPSPTAGAERRSSQLQIPLHFEANKGQSHPDVHFLARGAGYRLFLAANETVLVAEDSAAGSIRMTLAGGREGVEPEGLEPLAARVHHLKSSDPAGWVVGAPTYGRVRYDDIYPGIDLEYYFANRFLEYDFVVAPGADPGRIRLSFEGPDRLSVDNDGHLAMETASGRLRLKRPVTYQQVGGERVPIDSSYRLHPEGDVSFELGEFDPALPLTIDPVLAYSTYLGGSGADMAGDVVVDGDGNAYIVGSAGSANFPLQDPLAGQGVLQGNSDAFLAKLDASGDQLLFATYLGGNSFETGSAVALDSERNIIIGGSTFSTNFPAVNAFQANNNAAPNSNGFLTKLNPAGSAILFSTHFGGIALESIVAVAVDSNDDICFGGQAFSGNLPTTVGSFQPAKNGGTDAFVAKLDENGGVLRFATYLGGNANENLHDLAVGPLPDEDIFVSGTTKSADFPTTLGVVQTAFAGGLGDIFVTRLAANGSTLVYSTYLGGSGNDGTSPSGILLGGGIAVDAQGNAYAASSTASADFPTVDPILPVTIGPTAAFVSKLNPDGTALVYSTPLGGSGLDLGLGVSLDPQGQAVVVGSTDSRNFPVVDPIDGGDRQGFGTDGFVSKLNAAGNAFAYSTYLPGNGIDSSVSVNVGNGKTVVAGNTGSTNFPVASFQETLGGSTDAFVTALAEDFMLYFAQFGNGGGLTSDIVLTNPDDTATVTGTVAFFGADGSALSIGIASSQGQDQLRLLPGFTIQAEETSVDFEIGPRDAVTISTDGTGDSAKVGAAVVTADGRVGGVVRFAVSVFDLGIAGVGDSQPLTGFITPVRRVKGGVNTGVAIHNPGDATVDISLMLLQAGAQVAQNMVDDFPGHGHQASFIDEQALFKTYFDQNDPDSFVGTLVGTVAGGSIAVTALEQAIAPGQFTTLPVTPLN